MKKVLILAMLAGCANVEPEAPRTLTVDEIAVIEAAELALMAITNEDTTLLRDVMTEDATFYAVTGDDQINVSDVDFMNARFTAGPDFFERMWDPEVRINGRLAMVWTPYDFYLNKEFSHCGIDVFHLARMADGWKVMSIAFNRQTEGCPQSPLGPPDLN
jgi:hypothetical protein